MAATRDLSSGTLVPPTGLVISTELRADALVLTLYGELDLATIPHLEQQLELARDHDRLVIDLSALRFMDCSGLRVLLAATQHAQENDQQLHLLRGAPPIQRVFELTNTSALFTFAD